MHMPFKKTSYRYFIAGVHLTWRHDHWGIQSHRCWASFASTNLPGLFQLIELRRAILRQQTAMPNGSPKLRFGGLLARFHIWTPHFCKLFLSISTISKRSCTHISGVLLRFLLPLALMDFRVFSSLSSYRPRRPMRWTDSRKHRSDQFAIVLKKAPQLGSDG